MPKSKHRSKHKELAAKRKTRIEDFHKSYQNMLKKSKTLNLHQNPSAEKPPTTSPEGLGDTISDELEESPVQ